MEAIGMVSKPDFPAPPKDGKALREAIKAARPEGDNLIFIKPNREMSQNLFQRKEEKFMEGEDEGTRNTGQSPPRGQQ